MDRAAAQAFSQGFTFDKFEDEQLRIADLLQIVNRPDVGMI
jgi:hypothetical protein